jgi:hypothetical protein
VIHWNGVADNLRQELERRIEVQIIQSENDKLKNYELTEKNKSLEILMCEIQLKLDSALESNHQHWLLAESRKINIDALLDSRSWKITKPLRAFSRWIKQPDFIKRFKSIFYNMSYKNINKIIFFINKYPSLRKRLLRILSDYPNFLNYVVRLAGRPAQKNIELLKSELANFSKQVEGSSQPPVENDESALTSQEYLIFLRLKELRDYRNRKGF